MFRFAWIAATIVSSVTNAVYAAWDVFCDVWGLLGEAVNGVDDNDGFSEADGFGFQPSGDFS